MSCSYCDNEIAKVLHLHGKHEMMCHHEFEDTDTCRWCGVVAHEGPGREMPDPPQESIES